MAKNIVILNGSPRQKGNTSLLVEAFSEGAKSAGHTVTEFFLGGMDIHIEQVKLPQAAVLASPNPVTVVCTEKPDGSTSLATVSWRTYLSFNPEMIAYAMAKTSCNGELV